MAKGGGSWKVAYADFVTAMMAFFLVMWIGAQDAKTRQSVAAYFVDPSGADKKPVRSGATFDTPSQGSVPNEQKSQTGRGREPVSKAGEFGPATKMVADWIAADPKRRQEWKDKARASVEAAVASPGVRSRAQAADEVAAVELGNQLRAMFTAGSPAKANDVYQDLVLYSLKEVNWKELAEDLIRQ